MLLAAVLVLAAAGLLPLAASAVPITQPTGLNPGDQYRLAFLTGSGRDGTSTDIADYNAFVTAVTPGVPQLAALGTTWKAIVSTSAVSARDNTSTNPIANGTGVPIYLLNDTKLADNNADLWDGTLDTGISVNQLGLGATGNRVWTGTNTDGTISTFPLGAFDVDGGPWVGFSSSANGNWVHLERNDIGFTRVLYAISDVITVIPEPSTATLLVLGLTVLGMARRQV
jgi:hypothetical protein